MIEPSTHCNAKCPLCPRNLFGNNKVDLGYTKRHMTLDEIKTIFPDRNFLDQLEVIILSGNLGDPLMNPHILDIVDYLAVDTFLITNGSLRNDAFWRDPRLIKYCDVGFGIDGLEDTHSRYRRGTDYNKIMHNARTFIEAGGRATWKMIPFDHNEHQIEECRQLAKDMGFGKFELTDDGRKHGPVFDDEGNLEDILGTEVDRTNFKFYSNLVKYGKVLLEDLDDVPQPYIDCKAIKGSSIYINALGKVYPCCWMGFEPGSYGRGRWHEPVNKQITAIERHNDALQYPLEECIEWFSEVQKSWLKETFAEGRLVACNAACGSTCSR